MCVCLGQRQEKVGPVKSENKTREINKKKKDYEGRRSKLEAGEQRTLLNTHKKKNRRTEIQTRPGSSLARWDI